MVFDGSVSKDLILIGIVFFSLHQPNHRKSFEDVHWVGVFNVISFELKRSIDLFD